MRLVYRLFIFISSLFVALYGVLPGFFKIEGDFVASFVAGRSFLQGVNPTLFYHFPFFQKLIDASGFSERMVSFVASPPSAIITDALMAIPPASISRFLLTAANIVALAMVVYATAKIAGAPGRTAFFVFLSSSFALAVNFQSSAPFIMLTLLFVLAFYAYSIGSVAACGVFLGIAFPFYPLFVIPPILFLLSGKWRAFAYFLTISLAILALTYIVLGESTVLYYVQRVLPPYLNGKVLNPFSDSFQTAPSLLRRLFVYNATLNPLPSLRSDSMYLVAGSAFKAAVVVPSAYFFYKGISRGIASEALAAASFPVIFLSPLLTSPALVILAPAVVIVSNSARSEGRWKLGGAIVVLYAIACLPILSLAHEYVRFSSVFLSYERFMVLVAIYALYLLFQSRIVPSHLRTLRFALTLVIVVAVTVTLYLGDRVANYPNGLPVKAVLTGSSLSRPAFSPGLRNGQLTYVCYDSASSFLSVAGANIKAFSSRDVFRYASGRFGRNFGLETVKDGRETVYFKTRFAEASFEGEDVCLSRDEDYGAFMRDGAIHIVDLDPGYIARIDSLSLLPYRIGECSFNSSSDNELVFVIDSLNHSYSVASYNLFSKTIRTFRAPFKVSLMCARGDTFFVARNMSDTTGIYELVRDKPPLRLLNFRANICDLTLLNHNLYLSSDFERGLNNPTVYRYFGETEMPGPQ